MKFDAIIIGSGQGGNPLSHKLADLGWKVAMIEKDHLGGSCVNYGCTPTKTMIASSRIAHYANRAQEFGIHTGKVRINFKEVVARKNKMVKQWRDGQKKNVAKRDNLILFKGHGRFVDNKTVEVEGKRLSSDHIFIDTGTRPAVPAISGLSKVKYLTNLNIMDLKKVPEHLLVLGGNYLGLEFGQMFRRFGSKVSIVEMNDQITHREDVEVSQALQKALEKEGIRFYLGHTADKVAKKDKQIRLRIVTKNSNSKKLSGTHLLVAVGRTPNTDDLGLENTGVELDERGFIKVNDRLETAVPGIWVIGDVKGGPAFTHISYDDFLIIFDNLVSGKSRSVKDRQVPYSLFTDPELGRVGMTEKEARAAGYRLKIGSIPMSWVARAIERDETAGLMKVVVNAENDRILGATVLGPEGGEIVQTLMALMMADVPYTLFEKSVYIHPTLTEGFFTLMDNVKEI